MTKKIKYNLGTYTYKKDKRSNLSFLIRYTLYINIIKYFYLVVLLLIYYFKLNILINILNTHKVYVKQFNSNWIHFYKIYTVVLNPRSF